MTSWPEQPPTGQPQTRRQAREFERSASRRAGTAEPTPAGQIPDVTTNVPPRPAEAPQDDAPQQDAAPQQASQAANEAPAIPASAFAEPGVSSPSRDAFDLFREAPDASRPEPVTQPMAILKNPNAPEAAGAQAAPTASASPASATQAPATSAPANGASGGSPQATPERTLTRRELRAMLQAQEANAQANHPVAAGEQVFPVAFTSGPEGGSGAATEVAETAEPTDTGAADAAATSEKTAWPFAPLTPSSAPAASRAGAPEPTVTQSSTSPFAAFGAPSQKVSAPAASDTGSEAVAAAPADEPEDTSAQERRPFTPPTGHWSTAAELDDQNHPITSRNVAQSTAATTTNALILPAIPQPSTNAPLTSTGEILVTGSIDLPRGMGATGAHPDRIDSSDLDRLLDGEENEFNTSEVQPVRASRAISTHTSTRGVIAPPKKRGNALPVVLMVTAGVLAVGVIALLVAAYVLKVF